MGYLLKLRSLLALGGLLLSPASLAGITVEPFAEASEFGLVVLGDADLGNGVHVDGGLYVGGDLTLSGGNTQIGIQLEDGSDALVVEGSITSSQDIKMSDNNYYVGGDNDANMQNVGEELESNPVTLDSGETVESLFIAKSEELSELEDTGATFDTSDINDISIELESGELNVVSLDDISGAFLGTQNAALSFEGMTTDTYLVINYDLSDDFTFVARVNGLSSEYNSNIIWNFTGDSTLTFANTVSSFQGSILAPESSVVWEANNMDGTLVAASLDWNSGGESHFYSPWSQQAATTPTPIPVPPALWLFALGGTLLVRQVRQSR